MKFYVNHLVYFVEFNKCLICFPVLKKKDYSKPTFKIKEIE